MEYATNIHVQCICTCNFSILYHEYVQHFHMCTYMYIIVDIYIISEQKYMTYILLHPSTSFFAGAIHPAVWQKSTLVQLRPYSV